MREDTIAAIATAPGAGGIGIVRVSGPEAERILRSSTRGLASQHFTWRSTAGGDLTMVAQEQPIEEAHARGSRYCAPEASATPRHWDYPAPESTCLPLYPV